MTDGRVATIGVFTGGLWAQRRELAEMTGMRPVRRLLSGAGLDAVAGWGFKPTATRARGVARARGIPYLAVEDGFFRSRGVGRREPTLSYVLDPVGIYYSAAGPSALEAMTLARRADPAAAARDAEPALDAIRRLGISKYNDFDPAAAARLERAAGRDAAVLVVDQTEGDAAVSGAGADRAHFLAMLIAAAEENPGRRLWLKTHPETLAGRRAGYLTPALIAEASAASAAVREAATAGRLGLLTERIAPAALFRLVERVYAVSSLLGFEALIAGLPVTCFGQSFYAGWGLTDDRAPPVPRRSAVPLACLAAAAFCDYAHYFTPYRRRPCGLETAIAHLCPPPGGLRARKAISPKPDTD